LGVFRSNQPSRVIALEEASRVEADARPGDGSGDDRARAFAAHVDRAALDKAYRYATLILGNRAEAEDATHDAALIAWRKFGELRDPTRFEAWFGRILVNACRDRLRARNRLPVHIDPPRGVRDIDTETMDRRQALARGLRTLSPDHREVVVLRFFEDLTVDQIAERTGARPGTVKSRLHYALRHLRDAFDSNDGSARDDR
jgi:RNA polymerase sigma-70 factor (ECF subfamily)